MTFISPPDEHALAVMCLTLLALILFTRERIPLESSSLFVLVALTVGFEIFPYNTNGQTLHAINFFSGFGHEALVAVCALMIAGHGLVRTGALEPVGRGLARLWVVAPSFSLLLTLVIGATLSAFVNNVPIVVLLLPILISVSVRTKTPASGVLMPMGFSTLVGGMSTTIGTSTNLLVVSVAADMGMRHLGMFDFAIPVLIAGSIALVYLWLIAPHLLPLRTSDLDDLSPRVFTAQLYIPEGSFAAGKTLSDAIKQADGGMQASRIQRADETFIMPLPDAQIRAGDRLFISDTADQLKAYERALGATLYSGDSPVDVENPLAADDQQVAQVVVIQGSLLVGSTLSRTRFADHYQLASLALHRPGWKQYTQHKSLSDVVLQIGDVMLIQGAREQIAELKRRGDVLVLDATSDVPSTRRAPLALLLMAGIILVSALGILPIAISALCGVLLMLMTGVLNWREATRALNTQVVMIVVASLALGSALMKTGGADYLAELFVSVSAGSSPRVLLSGLMLLMAILTNIVSNNAAAVIGTPIAIGIAHQLGMPEEPFVLAVLFGANMSYATPIAYKTNLLVMSAGGYSFTDFVRVGVPLTLIMWLAFTWLLPQMYGL